MISIQIHRWHIALLLYIAFVVTIAAFKPPLMFAKDGKPKHFASTITETTSVFAPAFVFPLIGLLCYFGATVIELITT